MALNQRVRIEQVEPRTHSRVKQRTIRSGLEQSEPRILAASAVDRTIEMLEWVYKTSAGRDIAEIVLGEPECIGPVWERDCSHPPVMEIIFATPVMPPDQVTQTVSIDIVNDLQNRLISEIEANSQAINSVSQNVAEDRDAINDLRALVDQLKEENNILKAQQQEDRKQISDLYLKVVDLQEQQLVLTQAVLELLKEKQGASAIEDTSRQLVVTTSELVSVVVADVNLDHLFDSSDLVQTFQADQYEDDIPGNSTWTTGDWNADGEFDSSDLVFAFQAGHYEAGN